jgi:hypothetical protein
MRSPEHVFVSAEHRIDDGPPKFGEFFIVQREVRLHLRERLFTALFRQRREVIAQLRRYPRASLAGS